MVLVTHPSYLGNDIHIERLAKRATHRVVDWRVPSVLYAYLLPEDFTEHPSDAAIKHMKPE